MRRGRRVAPTLPTTAMLYTGAMGVFVIGILKALLLEAAALLSLVDAPLRRARPPRALTAAWLTLSALSFWAFLNFGELHGDKLVHWTEQYHFDLGDKYLRTLRYDGLYPATAEALADAPVRAVAVQEMRDTITFETLGPRAIAERRREVRSRFDAAEWSAFQADLAEIVREEPNAPNLMDHGNTSSPSGALVPWLLMRVVPLRGLGFRVLACVDLALFAALFVACGRRASLPIAAVTWMAALLAPRVSDYLMGSLFRMDWLVAAAGGALALHLGRARVAGGLLAYAALSRPFALAFVLGAGVGLAGDVARGRASRRDLAGFVLGGALTAAVLVAASSLAFGGAIWPEYAARTAATLREGYYGANHGMRDLYAQLAHDGARALWHPVPAHIAAATPGVIEGLRGLAVARAAVALVLAAACFVDGAVLGAGMGVLLAFTLTVTNAYYQGMWAVLAFGCAVHAPKSVRARVGLAGIGVLFASRYVFEHLGALRYAQDYFASWTTLAFLTVWCAWALAGAGRRLWPSGR